MKIEEQELPGLKLVIPKVFGDSRGFFFESWNRMRYEDLGIKGDFVQDNFSFSEQGVLRGLHFQNPHAQGKLVQVVLGEVFDVAVDIRRGSPTFGRWQGFRLSEDNRHQVWIPPGFAHGFVVLSQAALFNYKCTDLYHPECEFSMKWDDPDIGIEWPSTNVTVSEKDRNGTPLKDFDSDKLPVFEEGKW